MNIEFSFVRRANTRLFRFSLDFLVLVLSHAYIYTTRSFISLLEIAMLKDSQRQLQNERKPGQG